MGSEVVYNAETFNSFNGQFDLYQAYAYGEACKNIYHFGRYTLGVKTVHNSVFIGNRKITGLAKFVYLVLHVPEVVLFGAGKSPQIATVFNGKDDWFTKACLLYAETKSIHKNTDKVSFVFTSFGAQSSFARESHVGDTSLRLDRDEDIHYRFALLDSAGDETASFENKGIAGRRIEGDQAGTASLVKSIEWLQTHKWEFALVKFRPYCSMEAFIEWCDFVKGYFLGIINNGIEAKLECYVLLSTTMKSQADFPTTWSCFLDKWLKCFREGEASMASSEHICSVLRRAFRTRLGQHEHRRHGGTYMSFKVGRKGYFPPDWFFQQGDALVE